MHNTIHDNKKDDGGTERVSYTESSAYSIPRSDRMAENIHHHTVIL